MRLFGWLRRHRDEKETSLPLVERVEALERAHKNIRLEWDETYEIVARQLRKLSKREQRAVQEEEAPQQVDIAPPPDSREALRAVARQRGLMR